jgi:hypothetical protein
MTGQSLYRLASRALRRQDFNHPPILIGGIRHKSQPAFRRQDFNHPPIPIGGIFSRALCPLEIAQLLA